MSMHRTILPASVSSELFRVIVAGTLGILMGLYLLGVFSLPQQIAPIFLLAALFLFILILVGNVRRLLMAIILLELPFHLDIYLDFHQEAAKLSAQGGLVISVTTLCLTALYILWLAESLTRAGPPVSHSYSLFRMSLPAFVYVVIVALSALVARDVNFAIFEISLLLQTFLFYTYVIKTVRTRQDVLFMITILLIGFILESLVMIGLRFVGHSIKIGPFFASIYDNGRIGGTIGSPNAAAAYVSLLLIPALSILLTRIGRGYYWLAFISVGLGGMALILTLSRGGWIGFALSLGILCWFAWRRGWLSAKVPLAIAFVVLLLSLLFHNAILTRIIADDAGAAYSRIPLMKLALRMIVDNPVLGVGANNFAISIEDYTIRGFRGVWLSTVHNKYLLVWAETGLAGFLAFVWFLTATIRRGWQGWKLGDRFLSPIALGLTAAMLGRMLHMTVDIFNDRQELFWLFAGLIAAISKMDGEKKDATQNREKSLIENS